MSSSEYDSDDEAPEDVSFSTGRTKALHNLEVEKSERKRGYDNIKEIRRKRDAQYKQQKEEKMLSLDILMKADEDLKKKQEVDNNLDEKDSASEDDESEINDESGSDREKEVENLYEEACQEITVAVIDAKEARPVMQSALEFKSKCLYGKRIKRVDMDQLRKINTKHALAKNRKRSRN